jgi:threonine synthase
MGLPIERLVIATNDNDILARTLATGTYETRGVVVTTSPSMDIQVSSNFERLLFEASGRDAATVQRYMANLKQSGAFTLDEKVLVSIRSEFSAGRASMEDVAATIRDTLSSTGLVIDPHTAAGVHVARANTRQAAPMIVLSTAHPAKFPAAVEAACGISPALPNWLGDLMSREEKFTVLPSELKMVEDYIGRHARTVF